MHVKNGAATFLSTATVGLLLAAGVLGGCSPGVAVSEDKTPDPVKTAHQHSAAAKTIKTADKAKPESDPSKAVSAYVAALTSEDPVDMRSAAKRTKPGSVAAVYLGEQADVAKAVLDGGQTFGQQKVHQDGDSFKACPTDGTRCNVFGGFKTTSDGLLTDLTVNGKSPGALLTDGADDVVTEDGIKFEFLSAYYAITGDALWVNVKVTSGNDPIQMNTYDATYRDPAGAQRKGTEPAGPTDLGANSNANISMVFPGVKAGGTVTLTGSDTVSYEDGYSVTLHVG